MERIYRFAPLVVFILVTIACNFGTQIAPPAPTIVPPSATPSFTATIAASNTPAPTDTLEPSSTPVQDTPTVDPVHAQQTQLVGTMFAMMGPSAHLMGFVDLYSNPVGAPLESWHDIPIMKEATAGQEFQADIYSYKATATLKQATDFYTKQSRALNWSCFPPSTGSSGTGNNANHQSTFLCGPITILIASFDRDASQVLVVLNKAP